MNVEFPVNWKIHELPLSGFSLTNLYDALTQNLYGSIDDTVLPSVSDPAVELAGSYPVFSGTNWQIWDEANSTYKPLAIKVGNVTLASEPTANRVQSMQSKSGTVALLEDTYKIRDTVHLKEGLVMVDWDLGTRFQCILSGNRQPAFYMAHSKAGMKIDILVVNNGTKQTIGTWDSAIKWPSSVTPAIPAATGGVSTSLLVTLRNVNGTIYGESTNRTHGYIADQSEATGLIST